MFVKLSFLLALVAVCFGNGTGSSGQMISIDPEISINDVGEEAIILCKLEKATPLNSCMFTAGSVKFSLGTKGIKNYTYYGTPELGECGVKLTVLEQHHGNVTCSLGTEDGAVYEASMVLVVSRKPKEPVLTLDSATHVEGSNVTATCVVAKGRPAAEITWTFDGKKDFNNITHEQQPVGHTTTVTERAMWTVTADDDQKLVTCEAKHHSWKPNPKIVNKTITVHYKPRIFNEQNEAQEDILYKNLQLGETASILIKLKSNPAPSSVEMIIANTTLTVGENGTDGKYDFSESEQKNGYYIYNLIIKNLTKEDLQHIASVNVTNSVGSSIARLAFSIQPASVPDAPVISTAMPKDRAVASNTVTGVVIAISVVSIVIITVFMFARLNKKWCFASKPPLHAGQLVSTE